MSNTWQLRTGIASCQCGHDHDDAPAPAPAPDIPNGYTAPLEALRQKNGDTLRTAEDDEPALTRMATFREAYRQQRLLAALQRQPTATKYASPPDAYAQAIADRRKFESQP